ncbi:sulfotransferase family 2 domain-containing protein [uncultured Litoreibacter sp.]|uniref:sulfotransferase family 2 domain-containing protein n=1 Tax=uncultured Litoreibacter sp. TaxID=1392394 RepID=UPI00262562B6|nr:sulfotransferase family 2 domain-containing protein [uncultured Litoreibacter sp.]
MIYSPKHGYIFIHIPKTGGTSMALALENRAAKDDVMLGDTPKAIKRRTRVKDVAAAGRLWKHSTLFDIDGLVTREQVAASKVFCMVRNPWDRIVSYYHWLQTQNFYHEAVRIAKTSDFSEFLNHDHTKATFKANPYGRYVTGADGKERCDLFVRLEHLDEDLPKLEALIGLKLQPFPHENSSERGAAYQGYYGLSDKRLVSQLAAEDIERFGYSFD